MEHSYSTAIEVTAQNLQDDPLSLAGVTAHEFFHLWNVKRIRPQSLEPRDYTREKYTTSRGSVKVLPIQWANILYCAPGLLMNRNFFPIWHQQLVNTNAWAAHATQSAEEASMDAWCKSMIITARPKRSISYYNKGELIGVLLDLKVRETSHGIASLRDVFHWLNTNYAQKGRFFSDSEGVREAAEAVGHADYKDFFQKYVSGTQQIPWDDFFSSVGLHLERRQIEIADLGFTAVHNFGMPPIAVFVKRGSAAEKAGLSPGDSIVEINGHAVSRDFDMQLARLHPGDMLRLQIKNSLGKRDLQWKVGAGDEMQFELNNMDKLTPQQKTRRAAWLCGESEAPGDKQP